MADAASAPSLPLEPPQQQPASTPKDIKIETDLALDIPGSRGSGDWTVKGLDMRGNVQFTRPIPGGGLETRELSKEMYQAVRDLPQNRKRIKTKRTVADNQSITLESNEDIRVVGFDAATRQVLIEGTINGTFTQEWISSQAVDRAVRNDPGGLKALTETLAPHVYSEQNKPKEKEEEKKTKEKEKNEKNPGEVTKQNSTVDTSQPNAPLQETTLPQRGVSLDKPLSATRATSVTPPQSTLKSTSTPLSPITELRTQLRAQKQASVSLRASIPANDNASKTTSTTTALAGLSQVKASLVATQQRQSRDITRISEEQAQVAKALTNVQQQLQQPQLSQEERVNLEQERTALSAEQTRLNGERTSVSLAQVKSEQQLADVEQAQQAIEQGASPEDYASLLPPPIQLNQTAQALQTPQQAGPRLAVAQQQSPASAQSPGLVAIGLPPETDSGVTLVATPSLPTRIRTSTPNVPIAAGRRRAEATSLPSATASPTPIRPLQDAVFTNQVPSARPSAPSVDGYASSAPAIPVHDPFDLQTPSYTQLPPGGSENGADADAEKLSSFQEQQQLDRKRSQHFLGLPEGDVLGQSRGVSSVAGSTVLAGSSNDSGFQDDENATQELPAPESPEDMETERADTFQQQTGRDRLRARREKAVQEAAQKQKEQLQKQVQQQLQASFQKLKMGSKAGSISVVLILVYLLVLHIQMINKCWPKSKYIPPSKLYEDMICVTVDLLILVGMVIQIKLYMIPFELLSEIFKNMSLSDVLSTAWNAATN